MLSQVQLSSTLTDLSRFYVLRLAVVSPAESISATVNLWRLRIARQASAAFLGPTVNAFRTFDLATLPALGMEASVSSFAALHVVVDTQVAESALARSYFLR